MCLAMCARHVCAPPDIVIRPPKKQLKLPPCIQGVAIPTVSDINRFDGAFNTTFMKCSFSGKKCKESSWSLPWPETVTLYLTPGVIFKKRKNFMKPVLSRTKFRVLTMNWLTHFCFHSKRAQTYSFTRQDVHVIILPLLENLLSRDTHTPEGLIELNWRIIS